MIDQLPRVRQIDSSRSAQGSVRRTALIAMLRSVRRTVVSGTMPTPTLHSTSRQIASKLRSCTRRRMARPMRLALSARKRWIALARSRPTMS
jgi:hypothetical protein